MEDPPNQTVKVFQAGSSADPGSPGKLGRCLSCNRIVHHSRALRKWVYDNGTFHTGHIIEVKKD